MMMMMMMIMIDGELKAKVYNMNDPQILPKRRVKKTRLIIKMKPASPKSLEVLNLKLHEVLHDLIDDTTIEHNHNIIEKVFESKAD